MSQALRDLRRRRAKLTSRQLAAARLAVEAALAGPQQGWGNVTRRDMEGAQAKLEDMYSRLTARDLARLMNADWTV